MAAKGFIFDLASGTKVTVATGVGVLRCITMQINDETSFATLFGDLATCGIEIFIDGEGTASTDLDFRELFGGVATTQPGLEADLKQPWINGNGDFSMNGSRPNTYSGVGFVDAGTDGYFAYGERSVRIPFDTSLEALLKDVGNTEYCNLEVALF